MTAMTMRIVRIARRAFSGNSVRSGCSSGDSMLKKWGIYLG